MMLHLLRTDRESYQPDSKDYAYQQTDIPFIEHHKNLLIPKSLVSLLSRVRLILRFVRQPSIHHLNLRRRAAGLG
jgi:hypothetical protein